MFGLKDPILNLRWDGFNPRPVSSWLRVLDSLVRDDQHAGESREGTREELAANVLSTESQPFAAGAMRSLAAIVTRSARESALIFRITLPRCAFTVISLIPSSPPTCLFSKPETTSAMTSRSRGLSDS